MCRHWGGSLLFGLSWLFLVSAHPQSPGPRDVSFEPVVPGKNAADMNVILIIDDSLGAGHLGCYEYWRNTSPFIDALAGQATVFEQAMSTSSYTCESVSAVFSGLLPSVSGVSAGWFATPTETRENMAELFSAAGYVTGYFTNWAALHDPAFDKGFTETAHITPRYGVSGNGDELSQRVLEFAARHVSRKTLTCIHYADPHYPYAPSDALYLRFAPEVYPAPLQFNDVVTDIPALVASGFGPGEERFDDFVLRYDAEIAGIDGTIQRLVEGLDTLGALDRTLIVLTADHGQEFLEHGFVGHACYLYHESVHVPLLFWAPGVFPAQRIPDVVSLVDILPTLLEVAEVPHTRSDFSGAALFQRDGDAVAYVASARPVIAETLLETRNIVRTVINGDFKYQAAQRYFTPAELSQLHVVHTQEVNAVRAGLYPLVDPWGPVVHEALFRLSTDPGEQNSVLAAYPAETAALRGILEDFKTLCQGLPQEYIPASARPRPPDPNLPYPVLTDINPPEGPIAGGTRVALRGTNLAGATILFDGIAGAETVIDPAGTVIAVTAPAHAAGAVSVRAATPLGTTYPLAFVYQAPPPQADFRAHPTEGDVPLTVQFEDLSVSDSDPVEEWLWDFGDGNVSTENNPVHTYEYAGAYTVTLVVHTANNTDSRTRVRYVDAGHVLPAMGSPSLAWAACGILLLVTRNLRDRLKGS